MIRAVIVALAVVLVTALVFPSTGAVPEHDEGIFWFKHFGEEGVATNSTLPGLTCSYIVATLDGDSPCDIRAFEIGNTDTHVFFRWTLASVEIASQGSLSVVDFNHRIVGTHEEEHTATIFFRLTGTGELVINPENSGTSSASMERDSWVAALEEQKDSMLDADNNQITYAIPLDLLGDIMHDGEGTAWAQFRITRLTSYVNPVGAVTHAGTFYQEADRLSAATATDQNVYVVQPVGSLEPREMDPQRFYQDVEGDVLEDEVSFSTGSPTTTDPWAAMPLSAMYVYNWTVGQEAFNISLSAEAVRGLVAVEVTPTDGSDPVLLREAGALDLDLRSGGSASFSFERSNETQGVWNVTVHLDRFEGTFNLDANAFVVQEEEGEEGENGESTGVGEEERSPVAPVLLVVVLLFGLLGPWVRKRSL